MHIRSGTTRVAFVFPLVGLVVKVAKIRLLSALALIVFRAVRLPRGFLHWLRHECEKTLEHDIGVIPLLCKGVYENWTEFRFYKETRSPFLQPTYLSLGIVNIQKFGQPCLVAFDDLWSQLYKLCSGSRLLYRDSHHFAAPSNYCVEDRKLRMVDYGGMKCRLPILIFGERVYTQFDVTYVSPDEN